MKLSDGTKLVKIRNPWGKETYHGPWSDKSDKWNSKLKQEAGHTDENDGVWFISAEDYHENFYFTSASVDVSDEHMTYFAAFDVKTPSAHSERLRITSEEDQTVHISVYTYDTQHIRNGDCDKFSEDSRLWYKHDNMSKWSYFKWGDNHSDPV